MTIKKRIEALAGGQVAVLVIVGLILTYMCWKALDWDWFDTSLVFAAGVFVCAAGTAFLAFTWFGRKPND
jgi:uncharacterized membrane protein YbhN (UPF0104 family)